MDNTQKAIAGIALGGAMVGAIWLLSLSQASPPAGTGTLYGLVTDAENPAPLEGVLVEVEDSGGPVTQVSTDSSGHFQAQPVTPGDYLVRFSKAGYVSQVF
ncbi:MAG: carboxypeptidase-like regulatory domain-containing protein [Dehalococcoidales bacterium]|nr:carboxypeptidase-like regulatory domain-containing protein [Dehalococcoidales bacterium]